MNAHSTTGQHTDEQLLLRYRDEADTAAFETLVQRYEKRLSNYLCHYLHNPDLAQDVLQATLLRLHEKCGQFTEDRRVGPWLYSIATHAAIDALRETGRHPVTSLDQQRSRPAWDATTLLEALHSPEPSPLEKLEQHEQAERARRAVNELPDEFRVIVLLMYFEGLTLAEIAEALHLPLGTVKSRLHKALGALKRACQVVY